MSRRTIHLRHGDGSDLGLRVHPCTSFLCRLRGLMFRREIADDEGLLFVESAESRVGTSIHMFFVVFPIGVIWMDGAGTVVDKVVALPWRPYYAPQAPARYFLEGPPSLVNAVQIGERLDLTELNRGAA